MNKHKINDWKWKVPVLHLKITKTSCYLLGEL